jgi:hypothetical protein
MRMAASTKENDMSTNKSRLATLTLALAAVAMPLGLAAPSQASTTKDGCTVTPSSPEFRGTFDPSNNPYVYYPIKVTCGASASGLSVEVKTVTFEQDLAGRKGDVDANGVNNADDERIGSATSTRTFTAAGGTKSIDIRGTLPRTDTDGNEEMYDSVTFRVTSGPVTGSWSTAELTQPTQIWW